MIAVERVHCEQVPDAPHATWSNALVIGDEIVMSGMTAHPAGELSAYDQTMVVLQKIRALVESAGGAYPCSTLVEVSGLVFPELRVEIEACARLDIARRAAK